MKPFTLPTGTGLGTLAGVVAILGWSSNVALSRRLSEGVGALPAAACAYTLAGLILMAMRWRRQRRATTPMPLPPRRYLLIAGPLFIANLAMLFIGIGAARTPTQALAVGLLNYLWPTLTLVLAVPLLGQRARPSLLPGTLLALGGVFLVMTAGSPLSPRAFIANASATPWPYLLGLGSAITWALYSTLTRRWVGGAPGAVEPLMLSGGLVLMGLWAAVAPPAVWAPRDVIEVAVLGGASAIAYGMWDYAMRHGNVATVAACSYLTPLFAVLVASAYLGLRPGAEIWSGCLLIILGSLLSRRGVSAPKPRTALT